MSAQSERLASLLKTHRSKRRRDRLRPISQIISLRTAFESLEENKSLVLREILGYFPISLVTALEVFFRHTVAELIDAGSPYVERSEAIAKSIKFDLEMIRALAGRNLSLGEVIAQAPAFQSLGSVCGTMDQLTESKFLTLLLPVRNRWEVEVFKSDDGPVIKDIDFVTRNLTRLYEVRHILVHEMPRETPCDLDDIRGFFEATDQFITAAYWFVSELLEPNAPLLQQPMNAAASRAAQAKDEELARLCADIRQSLPEHRHPSFDTANAAWKTFRIAEAEFQGSEYEGGTAAPFAKARSFEDSTKRRIAFWKEFIEDIDV